MSSMCQNFGVVGVGLCFLKKLLLKVSQIYRKTPVLESLRCRIKACKFIKRLRHRCFVVNFEKFLRMIFCRTNAILLLFCLLFFGQIIERFLNNTFFYVESIIFAVFQKQLFADVLQNRCSLKLCNSHRKQLCRIF